MSARLRPNDSQYFERIVVDANGCWMWTGPRSVHGRAILRSKGRSKYAYRVVWEELIGPIPDGLMCCHKCDEPACVNPEHIFLGTAKDNMRDAADKGRLIPPRAIVGERNPKAAPVSDAVIDEARREYAQGCVTQAQLAERFNVGQSTVGRWLRREARNVGESPKVLGAQAMQARWQPCGTRGGYSRHINRHEPPCQPCKQANTEYLRAYKARRKAEVVR